jgi:hypothetical protein
MARSLFIICSQSIALDQITNALCVFHVLEGYDFSFSSTSPQKHGESDDTALFAPPSFFANAVWMRTEDDVDEDVFEWELSLAPPGKESQVIKSGLFSFTKTFFRITVGISVQNIWTRTGICSVECRIRKVGSEMWISQDYPIPITVKDSVPS